MKSVLLHVCCGICAIASIERLKEKNYAVDGFFFNPNIYPSEEYMKRKMVMEKIGMMLSVAIIEGEYNPAVWFELCGRYADEKEGGARCLLCYEMRLSATRRMCEEKKYDYFTTTLTISPHKNSREIIEMGKTIGKEKFLAIDFKKENGFGKSISFAKKNNLYRQNYCGCRYSMRERT